jgi:hypothetical protein
VKKIVLNSLSPDIERLVDDRAKAQHLTREQAVIEFLRDAWIKCAVKHDMAILEKAWLDDEDEFDDDEFDDEFDDDWVESFAGMPDDFVRPPQ